MKVHSLAFSAFLLANVESFRLSIVFLEKKGAQLHSSSFSGDCSIINPIVLFATYSAFGNSIKLTFLQALGAIDYLILGIF